MNDTDVTVNFFLYVAGVILAIFITRWIFGIGAMVRNLKAQTQLLILMARKQGVDIKLINQISLKADVYAPNMEEPENTTVAA